MGESKNLHFGMQMFSIIQQYKEFKNNLENFDFFEVVSFKISQMGYEKPYDGLYEFMNDFEDFSLFVGRLNSTVVENKDKILNGIIRYTGNHRTNRINPPEITIEHLSSMLDLDPKTLYRHIRDGKFEMRKKNGRNNTGSPLVMNSQEFSDFKKTSYYLDRMDKLMRKREKEIRRKDKKK